MCIIDKFEYLCALKGVTAAEAYTEMKINKATISLWRKAKQEGNVVTPSAENAVKMSKYFGYPTDYFLQGNTFDSSVDMEMFEQKEKPTGNADGLTEVQREAVDLIMEMSDEQLKVFVATLKAAQNK